jgi:aminoglycoside 6-adenylyltransferase
VILTSTRANPHARVDVLSDYDIKLFVEDLWPFLGGDEWLETFGEVMVREPYRPVEFEDEKCVWRLVVFKDAPRIDFHINLLEVLEKDVNASELPDYYDLGYEVLLDKNGIAQHLKPPTYTAYRTKPPTESEYDELVNVFWLDVTYVAKGLFRDELFFAKWMLDDPLHHHYLKTALAWYIGMKSNWKSNPGAAGRWFKQQVDAQI